MIWIAQPGPQVMGASCPADFTFYGGVRGGGKSDCLLGRQMAGAERYGSKWNGLILRRKYKDFLEIRRRVDEFIGMGLAAERVGGDQQTNHVRFKNGAQWTLAAIQQSQQLDDFIGMAFTEISIDECGTFPFFIQMVNRLKGSLRSSAGIPCRMFGTGNPGGPGHSQVKGYFRLGTEYNQPPMVPFEVKGETRVFIPAKLADNPMLDKRDPNYRKRMFSITDPMLRAAWLDGNWDVYIGQAFNFSRELGHIIDPIWPIPEGAPLFMSFDWGFGAPFSVGWWWADGDGRFYRFMEWYGWNGEPNEGLRLTDSEIVQGIIEKERKEGIWGQNIYRVAGPDCFSKKPDYKGGGQGTSTADVFASHGVYLQKGDPDRKLKIRQFRERLRVYADMPPMLQVYSTCTQFMRTIPSLCVDEDNPEDIETMGEDHIFDESCHVFMLRPLGDIQRSLYGGLNFDEIII